MFDPSVNPVQAAIGFLVLLVVVGGLLALYYARNNAVEKTGYGALIMLLLVSLMIPVFWIVEGRNQAEAKKHEFELAVERGMMLYAQNCKDKCYAIDDNGQVLNPTYNGYTMAEFSNMIDPDVDRIISAGIYNPDAPVQPENPATVARSEDYGGGLLPNDIEYLRAFIRSADPDYLKRNGYPEINGFEDLPQYVQANMPEQYDAAISYAKNGMFGEPVDMTNQSEITMRILDPGQDGAKCNSESGCYEFINIKVKVGTKITWVNESTLQHSVTSIEGSNLATPQATDLIDSAVQYNQGLFGTGESFTYTVTQEAYDSNPTDHWVRYYCTIHPDMLAQIVIVP